jgi:antirestriction protein
MATLDGTDDIFDSRDVEERLDALDVEIADEEERSTTDEWNLDDHDNLLALRDERAELAALRDEFDHRDFADGITLISDDYFEDYARELADDLGAINSDVSWPLMYIDWEAAADSLKMDYLSVTFQGTEYWGRA